MYALPSVVNLFLSSNQNRGSWIAEWYHTWLWTSIQRPTPWAMSTLVTTNSLFDPSTKSMLFQDSIWFILFHTIICPSNLSCEFWNRKLSINEKVQITTYFSIKFFAVFQLTLVEPTFRLVDDVDRGIIVKTFHLQTIQRDVTSHLRRFNVPSHLRCFNLTSHRRDVSSSTFRHDVSSSTCRDVSLHTKSS